MAITFYSLHSKSVLDLKENENENENENKNSMNNIDYDSNSEPSIFEEEEDDTGTKNDVSILTGSLLLPPLVSYPTYESLRVAIRAWTKE